jgi:membrane dipeptidase
MDSLLIDTHTDVLKNLSPIFTGLREAIWQRYSKKSLGERTDTGHIDIPRLREGGVDCQIFSISSIRSRNPPYPLRTALHLLDIFYNECEKNRETITPVTTSEEIVKASEEGKIAALLSIEGADVIENDLGVLRMLIRLGVRMVGLVHSLRNPLADGITDRRTGGRISELGVQVVEELERRRVLVDVSHINDEGFWDLMDICGKPMIASHSNCREICDHPRNLTDEMIKALSERGAVIGVNFVTDFVHPTNATLEGVVDHIEHIIELVGVEHVGLGSDFSGIPTTPRGLEDVTKMPGITRELLRRGHSEEDIRKILGQNHLNLFKNIIG